MPRLNLQGDRIDQQSRTGYTPLQTASLYSSTDVTAVLILEGASLKLTNHRGKDARAYAERKHHAGALSMFEVVKRQEAINEAMQEIARGEAASQDLRRNPRP